MSTSFSCILAFQFPQNKMFFMWLPSGIWSLSTTSIVLAFSTVLAVSIYYYFQRINLPPGPFGLPYLGFWPFLDSKNSHLQLAAFKQKYGEIFSFTCTGRLYINLGTTKAVNEAHITKADCFGAKPEGFSLFSSVFGNGVGFIEGEQWKTLRKFFMNVVKERGLGSLKESMSRQFYDCINTTVEEIKARNEDKPIHLVRFLTYKCNIIMRITLFGEIGVTEEQLKEINDYFEAIVGCMTVNNLLLNGNFAKYCIFPFIPGFHQSQDNLKLIKVAIYKIINEHKATFNQEHLRDMIDDYTSERNSRHSKGDPTANHFTDKALMATLLQTVGDGVVSVASFIAMFFKILLDYPEEQDKIYKEIIEVIGPNRQPVLEDKSNLTQMLSCKRGNHSGWIHDTKGCHNSD